jgi:hypothetical protein
VTHNDGGLGQMDEQLKSRFEKVLEHYAGIIKERDDALIREKAPEISLKRPSAPWSTGSYLQRSRLKS